MGDTLPCLQLLKMAIKALRKIVAVDFFFFWLGGGLGWGAIMIDNSCESSALQLL